MNRALRLRSPPLWACLWGQICQLFAVSCCRSALESSISIALHLFHPQGKYESILPFKWPLDTSVCDVRDPLLGALQARRWVPGPRGQPAAPELERVPPQQHALKQGWLFKTFPADLASAAISLLHAFERCHESPEKILPVFIQRRRGWSWCDRHEKTDAEMSGQR